LYEIRGYKVAQGKVFEFAVFRGHISQISHLCIAGNMIVSGSSEGAVMVWPIPEMKSEQIVVVKHSNKYTDHDGFITARNSN
jgi:WD40 repeat protein